MNDNELTELTSIGSHVANKTIHSLNLLQSDRVGDLTIREYLHSASCATLGPVFLLVLLLLLLLS